MRLRLITCVLPFLSAFPAHAQITFTKVADTTTTAPTGVFSSFGVPSLSGGTAAFRAVFNGGSGAGIFTGSGGVLTTIAKLGDTAPTGTFSSFASIPVISGGTTAFQGNFNGGSGAGIFTGSGGALTTIAKTGDTAPTGTFSAFGTTLGISGTTTVFEGHFNGVGTNTGVFTGNGGGLTTFVKTGDAAPIGTFTNNVGDPAISGSTVAIYGFYNSGSNLGLFTSTGGALTSIVKTGDSAPLGTFTSVGDPALSGSTIAFRGTYNGGASSGVFSGSGGVLNTIVKTGDTAPVGTFTSFGALPAISGNNTTFFGNYNGGSSSGIFTGNGGALTSVVKTGDSLFGSTITNLEFGTTGYDGTNIAFQYVLANGTTGIAQATIVIPEPGTIGLLALGSFLVCRRRRGD